MVIVVNAVIIIPVTIRPFVITHPHEPRGRGATGMNTVDPAESLLTLAQATERIRMDHGSIIAVPGIDVLQPVMIAAKPRIPMVITPILPSIPITVTHSISMAHTVPPVVAM